jgi:hypothetical protein
VRRDAEQRKHRKHADRLVQSLVRGHRRDNYSTGIVVLPEYDHASETMLQKMCGEHGLPSTAGCYSSGEFADREDGKMGFQRARGALMRLVSVSIICMGFAQAAPAGMIGTGYLLEDESRAASISRMDILLARADVARQLEAFGVDQAMVMERLDALSTAELLELEGKLDSQVAGGDIIGLIGAVFVVLLILELVGVTDIFKSF